MLIVTSIPAASRVLASNELGRMWQQEALAIIGHRKEAADNGVAAVLRPAAARRTGVVKRVEAVVNRDLFPGADWLPREYLDAVTHGVRVIGVVQEVPRWLKDGVLVETETRKGAAAPTPIARRAAWPSPLDCVVAER